MQREFSLRRSDYAPCPVSTLIDNTIPCGDPAQLLASCNDVGLPVDWFGKPNSFIIPEGRGPGYGWILLTKGQLDDLDLTKDHTLTFNDDTTANPPRKLQKITILRAKCLTPGYSGDPNATFLCDVVDRRFFLAKIPVDKAFNLQNADGTGYLTSSKNGGSAWTWQTLVHDLATTLGLGTQTLPFTPDAIPENFEFWGSWAWEALNTVLDRIACTVKYDGEADTFSIIRQGVTTTATATAGAQLQNQLANKGMKTWDNFWNEPARGNLPEKVRVLFARRPQPTTGASPLYAVDVTLTATTGVEAGTVVQLRNDLAAIGATGTPTNSSALSTRATEEATDWLRKRKYAESRTNIVYRDFQKGPALLDETNGTMIYDDRGGAMRTELFSAPDGAMEAFRPFDAVLPGTSITVVTMCSVFADLPTGRCLQIVGYGAMVYSSGAWTSTNTFTINGHAWTASWTWPAGACCPTLTLTTGSGSGTQTVTMTSMGCVDIDGTPTMLFASNNSLLTGVDNPGCGVAVPVVLKVQCDPLDCTLSGSCCPDGGMPRSICFHVVARPAEGNDQWTGDYTLTSIDGETYSAVYHWDGATWVEGADTLTDFYVIFIWRACTPDVDLITIATGGSNPLASNFTADQSFVGGIGGQSCGAGFPLSGGSVLDIATGTHMLDITADSGAC